MCISLIETGYDGLIISTCFPKNVKALACMAKENSVHADILHAVETCDVQILVSEWKQLRRLDFDRIKQALK